MNLSWDTPTINFIFTRWIYSWKNSDDVDHWHPHLLDQKKYWMISNHRVFCTRWLSVDWINTFLVVNYQNKVEVFNVNVYRGALYSGHLDFFRKFNVSLELGIHVIIEGNQHELFDLLKLRDLREINDDCNEQKIYNFYHVACWVMKFFNNFDQSSDSAIVGYICSDDLEISDQLLTF